MEETEESTNSNNNNNNNNTTTNTNNNKKCNAKTRTFRGKKQSPHHQIQYQYQYQYQFQYQYQYHQFHHHHHLFQYSNQFGLYNHNHFNQNPLTYYQQALLPLPHNPIPIHLSLSPNPSFNHRNRSFSSENRLPKPPCSKSNVNETSFSASSKTHVSNIPISPEGFQKQTTLTLKREYAKKFTDSTSEQALVTARRPDSGGVEGTPITLLANHFLVRFDSSQRIYHYNVDISPNPSKDVARMIKHKLVEENSAVFSGSIPAYDGRKNLYSLVEFQNNKLELFIDLPIEVAKGRKVKLFRVNIMLVSKLDGEGLSSYLNEEGEDWVPLPQDYLHALDVVLREGPLEKCIPVGRSLYLASMSQEIGGGAVGLKGFFQSLRPTQQGLALNVDLSVTAFHESIGVIPFLQKRLESLWDLSRTKTRGLVGAERREVEKALRNIRVFVCHRETVQRYRVYGLTDEATGNLWFADRDGKNLKLVNYFKDHYNYEIQYRNLPCLKVSRSKPCYLPMELCIICEGQKFMGKLSDDQTVRLLKMGCQRPKERKATIDGIVQGPVGPTSGNQGREFKLHVSSEMTRLNGRVLQPPKLKLGDGGHVKELVPSRRDRQWNFTDSHVIEATRIERWALISFGGTPDQRSIVPTFINQLSLRCEQLGIFLNKETAIPPQFEPAQVLNNIPLLESKLKKIQRSASDELQLLVCVMEKKHRAYADLKRISETIVGVVTQCCLYQNLSKSGSQFLANLALKINAKVGGCTAALYDPLPSQIPRLLGLDGPAMFMGADVTHPHPSDDVSPSVAAVVGSVNWPEANRYASRMRSQTHRQEIIQSLGEMAAELLGEFLREVGRLPARIVFFRDGVSETQFERVLREELRALKEGCAGFPDYEPLVTFAVVQKRHHTRLFPLGPDPSSASDENVPPGTVVDTAIAHPKEFDFFLCSHWGVKGTSRPTHYHVLWDESGFGSDELQKLVYNLCFTYVRCTKPVSLVPPAYYAHLAAYRGRLYLERSQTSGGSSSAVMSRPGPPRTVPLPKLSENVRNLMFYC